MKKVLIFILFAVVFASVSFSVITFTFPQFDGQYYNSSSYTIGWLWDNDTGNWKCFKIAEGTDNSSFNDFSKTVNLNEDIVNYSFFDSKTDGEYY